MNEEDIEELKRLFYSNRLTQYGKRKLINYYQQQIEELEEIEESHRKENGELKERIKQLEDTNKKLYEIGKEIGKQHKYTSENYIPKSKVEEKIEELIKEGRHYNAKKIEVLQELLEE